MDDKTLYLECYSGISGDMTVAALLDLGADQKVLLDGLNSLKVSGFKVEIGRREKSSIDACDFNVILEHDMEHHHDHGDHHEDHDGHAHTHAHVHEHRNLNDINTIIESSGITVNAKTIAKKIFNIVAMAEAKVHSKPLEEVHFHEVGAVDSIVDIVAAAICLDNLNIKHVIVSELYEGTGLIECQHGFIPVPAPAVSCIAATHRLPLHITDVKGELVTPTGAAIVAAIRTDDALPKEMKIRKIGLGAGKRNYQGATGILRAMLIEDASAGKTSEASDNYSSTDNLISIDNSTTSDNITEPDMLSSINNRESDKVWVLEANLDDCTGEALAFAMDLLLQNGAKDVYYTPIYMKKNRPAYLLGVICSKEDISKMEDIIFTHTTTIGIRKHETVRTILPRVQKTYTTPYGDAQVKVCTDSGRTYIYPEYESVRKLCLSSGLDYMTMYHYVQSYVFSHKED